MIFIKLGTHGVLGTLHIVYQYSQLEAGTSRISATERPILLKLNSNDREMKEIEFLDVCNTSILASLKQYCFKPK